MTADLAGALYDNLRVAGTAFADLAPNGATRRFGSVHVGTAGVAVPDLNVVLVTDRPDAGNLEDAVAWMAARELPFQVVATDRTRDAVEALDTEPALGAVGSQPGMARPSLVGLARGGADLEVAAVADGAGLDAFIAVFTAVFDTPRDVVEPLAPDALPAGEALSAFVGRVDGEAVACGQYVLHDGVVGLYSIGVREPHRRRGFGAAMTRALLRHAREAGGRIGVLESTAMAVSLYESMGFDRVATLHHFEPAGQHEG